MELFGESITVGSNAPLKGEWSQIEMLLAQELNPQPEEDWREFAL